MRVLITGGTGLIGRPIVQRLQARGDRPVVLTRKADEARRHPSMRGVEVIQGDPTKPGDWEHALDDLDGVINLVGHNLFAKRWNREVKRAIRDSRVYSTEQLIAALAKSKKPPAVFVQASAIGYYGAHGDEALTERSPSGSDFLSVVCRESEDVAQAVTRLGTRLATMRTGIVLAKGAGALGAMVPVYKWLPLGAAPIGGGDGAYAPAKGTQWVSWIHLDDIVGLFLLALDDDAATGPINGTSPNPARHLDFGKALAKVLHRPFLPIGPPEALVQVLLGEVATAVTRGQKALPEKAEALGYRFQYPELSAALDAIFRPQKAAVPPTVAGSH